MSKSRLTESMKEMREGDTQQQVSMALNVSRESYSKYETGNAKLPKDISRSLMDRYDNPKFAFAVRNEYTQTGPVWLNGPLADLHRSSVREKALEEVNELMISLTNFSFAKPLKNLTEWEIPSFENLLEEAVEAITAIEHLVVIACEETGISYKGTWQKHHQQLKAKGYIQ